VKGKRSIRLSNLSSSAGVLLLGGLLTWPVVAQQSSPSGGLSLEAILLRLQINNWAYMAEVPDFFCDEHVVSGIFQPNYSQRVTTDSIFRLRRSDPAVAPVELIESREIKTVNKKLAQGETLTGPAIFTGGFGNGVRVVTIEMMHCYDYRLTRDQHLHHVPALVIEYVLKPSAVSDDSCPTPEKHHGRVWIDPQSLQPLRIEMKVPNHELFQGTHGSWDWSIDYAPVSFDNKLFWMPRTITSISRSDGIRGRWTFTATYTNYHKTNVTSHILTNLDDIDDLPPSPR
jgi:hypothetical protein